jgi:hypothetical protein
MRYGSRTARGVALALVFSAGMAFCAWTVAGVCHGAVQTGLGAAGGAVLFLVVTVTFLGTAPAQRFVTTGRWRTRRR